MVPVAAEHQNRTLFGHPTGLFTLFFAEMWERFSFYGMRALLLLYMLKGFLQFSDSKAYAIYGAYGTLVYAAPFIGGLLADRVLGPRRAVILGGLLMAGGHLLMAVQHQAAFFLALALLISGNGFFKPNISTIVGELYPQGSPKKDAGFTIFYMGINLGAALSPMLCAYLAHRYGWEAGFGLATAGMLIGVAIFAAPTRLTQILIFIGALGGCVLLPLSSGSPVQMAFRIFLTIVLAGAGTAAIGALGRGGLSKQVGRARDPERLRVRLGGVL
ncbi:MAG TPA: oligopeptide:H+ symporter, partial [Phycisphaerae bacterium]|nr:oligopeptide:H+ symporter [Phycisphaerae bacterium]